MPRLDGTDDRIQLEFDVTLTEFTIAVLLEMDTMATDRRLLQFTDPADVMRPEIYKRVSDRCYWTTRPSGGRSR
jgi:hypothetical protein